MKNFGFAYHDERNISDRTEIFSHIEVSKEKKNSNKKPEMWAIVKVLVIIFTSLWLRNSLFCHLRFKRFPFFSTLGVFYYSGSSE